MQMRMKRTARSTRQGGNLAVSKKQQKLARRGYVLYWTGRITAILLLAAIIIIFAILDSEPIFQRVASVLILGAMPALSIWIGASVVYKLLNGSELIGQRSPTLLAHFAAL
jgi:hypothetical protein